jgi:hypothetical protein
MDNHKSIILSDLTLRKFETKNYQNVVVEIMF